LLFRRECHERHVPMCVRKLLDGIRLSRARVDGVEETAN